MEQTKENIMGTMPLWGIRNTIISVVAYNMGAGYKERVKKLIKIAMTASTGMTIMMSGVFQAMNNSCKALIVSIVQAVTLVGSAALLALTHNTSVVWFAFPVSEIVIFLLSIVFLRGIYRRHLGSETVPAKLLIVSSSSDIM